MLKILVVGLVVLLSGCVAPKVNGISLSYSYQEHQISTSIQMGGAENNSQKF